MRSNRDTVIHMYFIDKLKPIDIAKKLNISKSAITQFLQTDNRYNEEKELRKNLNKIRHREDTKELIKKQRKIEKHKNNIDDFILKNMHEQAVCELSAINRLNNMTYRNWNKSAYNYNEDKKRFEFKKELGKSYDVPKYIKVEVL